MAQSKSTKHFRALTKYRKLILVFALLFVAVLSFSALLSQKAFAEEDSSEYVVETTFFGNLKDDGKGCGVYTVLNLVVDILSLGVGILGVIGITVAGIQYLTAGGNEQQVTKAKRRLFEIVIGLIAYAVLFAFMQWLLPGARLNTNTTCATMSDTDLAALKAKEQAARQEAADKANAAAQAQKSGKSSTNPSGSNNPPNASTAAEQIAQTAEMLAWPKGTKNSVYHHNYTGNQLRKFKSWSDLKGAKPTQAFMNAMDKVNPKHSFKTVTGLGADCGIFVAVVLKFSGHDPKINGHFENHMKKSSKWKKVSGKPQRGDVCTIHRTNSDGSVMNHYLVYLGSGKVAEAGHHSKNFGHVSNGRCGGYNIYRPL